jgi:hypothetical protein
LHRFSQRCGRAIYTPFLSPPPWKVNAVVMFWKASKAECCESGDEHFGVGRKTIDYTTITAPYASIRKA